MSRVHFIPIYLTDRKSVKAVGKGNIPILALIRGEWIQGKIHDVLHIPGSVNLFSESVMARKGYTIIRNAKGTRYVNQEGHQGPSAYPYENIYVMNFKPVKVQALATATSNEKLRLWHERCSHINVNYIRETVKNNAITGINLEQVKGDLFCEECQKGKQAKKPYPARLTDNNSQPGEIAHADLSGKMPVPSLNGSKYFLLIKDEASSFRIAYFLREKSEVPECIRDYIRMMETQTGRKLKIFRSDNGTEFVNSAMKCFLDQNGTIHETSVPYCPESNGKIEREMRTIKDSARTMLQQAKLPDFLWAEATATSVYVHNRLLNKQTGNKTALEQIFKRKPNLSHLRVFGCNAFSHVPDQKRSVWEAKGRKFIFVGYEGLSNKYRLFDPATKSIITARNVTFNESSPQDKTVNTTQIWLSDDSEAEQIEDKAEESQDEVVAETQAGPSVNKDDIEVRIETDDGEYVANIPANQSTTIHLPRLRDRSLLRPPNKSLLNPPYRYQTHAAMIQNPTNEPRNYDEAVSSDHSDKWMDAMLEEMSSHESNKTWELVPRPNNVKILDSRWIYKVKRNPDDSEKYKARLVIKGFKQQYGIDYDETFASVCRYESVRILLAVAAAKCYIIKQCDVKTAFLNGDLDEIIYMNQPQGFEIKNPNNLVCLLKKSLYGLKQAPRCWNSTLTQFLKSIKFKQTFSDPCVFIGEKEEAIVYLAIYVDDILILSPSTIAAEQVIVQISSKFEITVSSEITSFIGFELSLENGNIFLNQTSFIKELLQRFNMTECKSVNVPMQPDIDLKMSKDCDDSFPYRQLIGALLFLCRLTRPDISFAVGKLSQFANNYGKEHWEAGKNILRYLKGTMDMGIVYRKDDNLDLVGYSDSDFAGDKCDRKSTSGFAFFLGNGLVTWSSQKQPIVSCSSTEAEYIALANAAREAVWLNSHLDELKIQTSQVTIKVDNQSAIKLASNAEFHKRSKHIDVKYHYTRQLVSQKKISIGYVPTTEQKADIFTKPLLKGKHQDMIEKLGMESPAQQQSATKTSGSIKFPHTTSLMMMMMCIFMMTGTVSAITTISNPVIWRPSSTPITSGHNDFHLLLEFKSPCEILTNATVHKDFLKTARHHCDQMYEEYFLQEIRKMCPKKSFTEVQTKLPNQVLYRSKRFIISAMIAALVIGYLVPVGLGIAAQVTASSAHHRLGDVERRIHEQEMELKKKAKEIDLLKEAIEIIQKNVKTLDTRMTTHLTDYNEFKGKLPFTTFATSYITTRLLMGQQIIREANRAMERTETVSSSL